MTFAATHNAHAVAGGSSYGTTVPGGDNQAKTIHEQLRAGIRGMMIDLGRSGSTVDMCHGGCALLNYGPFTSGLRAIRRFLDSNPSETVTVMLELTDGVTAADASQVIAQAGLSSYVYVKPAGAAWPTLGALGKKMIFFAQGSGSGLVMSYWRHAFENPYSYKDVAAFDAPSACDADRGADSGLFVFNHFLTPVGSVPVGWGFLANNDSVVTHVDRCRTARGRLPNFVTVDWYNEGSYGGHGSLVNYVKYLNSQNAAGPATAL